jgi:tetratricopeptide (TPR) repeat protein
MGMNGILPLRAVASLVRAEAQQALDLNPIEVGPRLLLGGIAAAYEYDWKAAAEHFRVALAANPVAANARWAYASFYTNPFGRFEESSANMQLEAEQDPLNVLWRCILANHLHHAGMHARALVEVQKALELDANFWLAHYDLAESISTPESLRTQSRPAKGRFNSRRGTPWPPAYWLPRSFESEPRIAPRR